MSKITYVVTFHTKKYINECLFSLASQLDKDFDLIVLADTHVDDSLIDYVKLPFESIVCTDKKLIPVQGTGSAGFMRNYGFSIATTEWVSYIDGDDYIMPNTTELVNEKLAVIDPKVNFMNTGEGSVNTNGIFTISKESLYYQPDSFLYSAYDWTNGYMSQLQIIKKSTWEQYPYVEDICISEDIDFTLHQLLLGKYDRIHEPLYAYRNTRGSFSKVKGIRDLAKERYDSGYYRDLYCHRNPDIAFM